MQLPEGGEITGGVLADHVKSVDFKARRAKHFETASVEVLKTVRAYVVLLIGAKQNLLQPPIRKTANMGHTCG